MPVGIRVTDQRYNNGLLAGYCGIRLDDSSNNRGGRARMALYLFQVLIFNRNEFLFSPPPFAVCAHSAHTPLFTLHVSL